jgi:hypothetical protein
MLNNPASAAVRDTQLLASALNPADEVDSRPGHIPPEVRRPLRLPRTPSTPEACLASTRRTDRLLQHRLLEDGLTHRRSSFNMTVGPLVAERISVGVGPSAGTRDIGYLWSASI